MIMTIKEAETQIAELKKQQDDYMKLQNYALCIDLGDPLHRTKEEKMIADMRSTKLKALREEADIIFDVRTLCTIGHKLCTHEIERIQKIIDNTKINI